SLILLYYSPEWHCYYRSVEMADMALWNACNMRGHDCPSDAVQLTAVLGCFYPDAPDNLSGYLPGFHQNIRHQHHTTSVSVVPESGIFVPGHRHLYSPNYYQSRSPDTRCVEQYPANLRGGWLAVHHRFHVTCPKTYKGLKRLLQFHKS